MKNKDESLVSTARRGLEARARGKQMQGLDAAQTRPGKINMGELRRNLELLLSLTQDPHPGLSTWRTVFYECGLKVSRNFCDVEPTAALNLLNALKMLADAMDPNMDPDPRPLNELLAIAKKAIEEAERTL